MTALLQNNLVIQDTIDRGKDALDNSNQGSYSVADLVALGHFPSQAKKSGFMVFVRLTRELFVLDQNSVLQADGREKVQGQAGAIWVRLAIPHAYWLVQNDYWIDANKGSDLNDGIDVTRPLQSAAELARRWSGGTIKPTKFGQSGQFISFYCTVHLLSSLPDTDPFFPNCRAGAKTLLWVQGGADGAPVYSGTISSVVSKATATNVALGLVDAGATWASLLGKRWRVNSGTRLAMMGWVVKDQGSNTNRSSESGTCGPMNPTNIASGFGPLSVNFTQAAPLANDTYSVENLITITMGSPAMLDYGTPQLDTASFSRPKLVWGELAVRNNVNLEHGGTTVFYSCDFQAFVTNSSGGTNQFIGCHFGVGLRVNCGVVTAAACAFDNANSASAFGAECFQMGSLSLSQGSLFQNVGIHGSSIVIADAAVFDSAATGANASYGAGLTVGSTQISTQSARTSGWVEIQSTFWGQGNAGAGIAVSAGGKVVLFPGVVPTITGTGGDFRLNTATQARAWDDTAGAYTTKRNCTWTLFNTSIAGGGFADNVVDLASDAQIVMVIS